MLTVFLAMLFPTVQISFACLSMVRAVAMIASRILEPASKLATVRSFERSTLASELGVEDANEDELYSAMDWLVQAQPKVEARLAERHLTEGGLVLYDLTSVYLEGSKCELGKRGYSRDGKRGLPQIEFGLLTNREGCPVAVDVFEGNMADPMTVAAQVDKLKNRFGIADVVLRRVGGLEEGEALLDGLVDAGLVDATVAKKGDYESWVKQTSSKSAILLSSRAVPGGMSVVVNTSLSANGTPASGDGSVSPAATAASTRAAPASACSFATCRNA